MTGRLLPIVALASLAMAGGAQAEAPQILALLQTIAPVPLVCQGETCRAELSALCLQQALSAPVEGTAYAFAGQGRIELALAGADGKPRRVPAAAELEVASRRGHAAVGVSLPRARLSALGAASAAIAVGHGVALLPAALAAAPGHDEDLAVLLATGAWRAVGARLVADAAADVAQVGALNVMLNLLPLHDERAPDFAEALWRQAITGPLAAAEPLGLKEANRRLEACGKRHRFYLVNDMARCLAARHDAVLEGLNQDYWKAAGAGS